MAKTNNAVRKASGNYLKMEAAAVKAAAKVTVPKRLREDVTKDFAKFKAGKLGKAAVCCPKCGRDNGRPGSPACRNAAACKARVKVMRVKATARGRGMKAAA